MSFKSVLLKLFHLIAAAQFFFGVYYEHVHVLPEEVKLRKFSFGGKLIYLTFLNAIIQASYHTIALINDFSGTNGDLPKKSSAIRKFRDYIFSAFALPLGTHVAILFWSLYAIDRELVFPTIVEPIYPWWLNQILHTNVFIFIVIEALTSYHHYANRLCNVSSLALFSVTYVLWLLVVKHIADAWVYPILNILDVYERSAFLVFSAIIPLFFYFLGEFFNNAIWKKSILKATKCD